MLGTICLGMEGVAEEEMFRMVEGEGGKTAHLSCTECLLPPPFHIFLAMAAKHTTAT